VADIKGSIENGQIKGEMEIWPAVAGGILAGAALLGLVNYCTDTDGNPGTYKPEKLEVVEFSPQQGMECRGLSRAGSGEVIAATVVCVPVGG
jgi:hypothetical protein